VLSDDTFQLALGMLTAKDDDDRTTLGGRYRSGRPGSVTSSGWSGPSWQRVTVGIRPGSMCSNCWNGTVGMFGSVMSRGGCGMADAA